MREMRGENIIGYCILFDEIEYYTSSVYIFDKVCVGRGKRREKGRGRGKDIIKSRKRKI